MTFEAVLSLLVTLAVLVIFLFLVLETVRLIKRKEPITPYVRRQLRFYPARAFGIAGTLLFLVGMLFAHFVWDATCSVR